MVVSRSVVLVNRLAQGQMVLAKVESGNRSAPVVECVGDSWPEGHKGYLRGTEEDECEGHPKPFDARGELPTEVKFEFSRTKLNTIPGLKEVWNRVQPLDKV